MAATVSITVSRHPPPGTPSSPRGVKWVPSLRGGGGGGRPPRSPKSSGAVSPSYRGAGGRSGALSPSYGGAGGRSPAALRLAQAWAVTSADGVKRRTLGAGGADGGRQPPPKAQLQVGVGQSGNDCMVAVDDDAEPQVDAPRVVISKLTGSTFAAAEVEGAFLARQTEAWWRVQLAAYIVTPLVLLPSLASVMSHAMGDAPSAGAAVPLACAMALASACAFAAAFQFVILRRFVRFHGLGSDETLERVIDNSGALGTDSSPVSDATLVAMHSVPSRSSSSIAPEAFPVSARSSLGKLQKDASGAALAHLCRHARTLSRRVSLLSALLMASWALGEVGLMSFFLCEGPGLVPHNVLERFSVCRSLTVKGIGFFNVLSVTVGPHFATSVLRVAPDHFAYFFASTACVSLGMLMSTAMRYDYPAVAVVILMCALSVWLAFVVRRIGASAERRQVCMFVHATRLRKLQSEGAAQAVRAAAERDHAEMRRTIVQNTLGYLAHETRNPLHASLGIVRMMREDGPFCDSPTDMIGRQDDIDHLQRALEHIQQVTDDVLDLQALEHGLLTTERRVCSVTTLLSDLVSQFNAGSSPARATISLELHGVPDKCLVDDVRVRQLVYNGLTNAFKAGGPVVVCASHADEPAAATEDVSGGLQPGPPSPAGLSNVYAGFLHIEVRNRGRGLKGISVKRLFKSFTQNASDDIDTRVKGSGLGLAVCDLLAELLGGAIGLYDDDDGWTVFWVRLPFKAVTLSSATSSVSASLPAVKMSPPRRMLSGGGSDSDDVISLRKPLHILIVEDDPVLRRLLARMVKRLGCTLVAKSDGDEVDVDAIAWSETPEGRSAPAEVLSERLLAVGSRPFDCVITDLIMDRLGGTELCRRLRGAGFAGPIFAATGNAEGVAPDSGFDAGTLRRRRRRLRRRRASPPCTPLTRSRARLPCRSPCRQCSRSRSLWKTCAACWRR